MTARAAPAAPSPADGPPLAEWARGVRSGDLAAFEALFRTLHPMLLRVALSLSATPAEADDAVQETFVRLWEHRARLDPEQSVRAYLARSVRNRVLNVARDARTRQTLLERHAAEAHAADTAPPDDGAPSDRLVARLRAFLADLPNRQRTAIALTRFDGLSHAGAADAMGCSARTVNNHIVRGLRTLRERLGASDPDDV